MNKIVQDAVLGVLSGNNPYWVRKYTHTCGIYILFHGEVPVYVGQSTNIVNRISEHRQDGKIFDSVRFFPCAEDKLNKKEKFLIKILSPRYNSKDIEIDSCDNIYFFSIKSAAESGMFGDIDQYIKSQSVDILALSIRSQNALSNASIKTIGDLCAMSKKELKQIKQIGKKSADEIMSELQDFISKSGFYAENDLD